MGAVYSKADVEGAVVRQNGVGTLQGPTGKVLLWALIIGTAGTGTVTIQDGAGNALLPVFAGSLPAGSYPLGFVARGFRLVVAASVPTAPSRTHR